MKTRRLAFAAVLTALPVLAVVTADPAAQPAAVGAPTREPAPHPWLYRLFTPWAAEIRARLAGDDRELSDSITLTALPPVRREKEDAPMALPAPVADDPRPAPVRETATAGNFSVPIVAPTAARVTGLELLPWAAATAGSAQPSGLAASATATRTSPGGPVFSLGSTPASFGADAAAAAAPLASGQAGAGAPSTRRSTAVVGPQPQTATQSGFVNTTDPNLGYTYLGATYTVLSPTDAFAVLVDGYDRAGTVTHSSGTLTIGNFLDLGDQPGGNGTYNLSGTGIINTPVTYVGYQGTGVFNQSGGTHNVTSAGFLIGYFTTGNGTYALSGGTLSVTGTTSLGSAGTGCSPRAAARPRWGSCCSQAAAARPRPRSTSTAAPST